jgi:large subunit ribosomal protein L19
MSEEKKAETSETAETKTTETKRDIPKIKPGMTVRVYQKIKETNAKGEEKERLQYFEGLVLTVKHGNEPGASITMRKVTDGVGVEKIFPLHLPTITKIEVKKQVRVRRAKLNFLKNPKRRFKRRLKNVALEA